MAKRKPSTRSVRRDQRPSRRAAPETASSPASEDQISYGSLSLHALFEQQARQLIDRTDLDEEQKQSILLALSCPCCGAGAMSYTAKLKR